jgi:membrane protein DedA with SNARE-associated domain
VLLTHKDLDRAESWFAKRGEPVVLFGRFVPLLRSFVSFVAGLAEMSIGKFLMFTTIGCAVWCAALTSVGYSLGSSYNHAINAFRYAGYVAAALALIAVAVLFWHRLRVVRSERSK